MGLVIASGCGYHFGGGPVESPFDPDIKTIEVRSAVNNTNVTGIEVELTNGLREEFALGARLKPVRSGGDVILTTLINSYQDVPASYKADGKELTRIGTLEVVCKLQKSQTKKPLWEKTLSSSLTYLVAETAAGTLANRRRAKSTMIRESITRIERALYDNF